MTITRTLGPAALTATLLVLAATSASIAHDPKDDLAALRREVSALRAEKNALQDQHIDLARRFDTEKHRLQLELEAARKELARLGAGGAADAPEVQAGPLDAAVTVSFDRRPLAEVAAFIAEKTGLRVAAAGLEGVTVSLRVADIPAFALLDLLVTNARDASGAWKDLEWGEGEDGAIVILAR